MDILTQFWAQFIVILLFIIFLLKDLFGVYTENLKVSSIVEFFRYLIELVVVASTGFLSWNFFKICYVLDVSFSLILTAFIATMWRTFLVVKDSSSEMKSTLTSKVRLWDFASIILLFVAGFFDGLIIALWK